MSCRVYVSYPNGAQPFPLLGPQGGSAAVAPAALPDWVPAVLDAFARAAGPSAAALAPLADAPATGAVSPALVEELRRRLQQVNSAGLRANVRAPLVADDAAMPAAPAAAAPAPSALRAISRNTATWLQRPLRGPQVTELQNRLRAAGFDPGPSDGYFGPVTERAVRAFQRAAGITVDGRVGPQTVGALLGGGAPAPSAPATPGGPAGPAGDPTAAPPQGAPEVTGPSGPVPASIDGMLSWARSKIGTPYAAVNPFRFGDVPWDGKPHTSVNGSGTVWNYPKGTQVFDCSGFVVAAYRQAGVDLAKWGATSSSTIANSPHLQNVSQSELRPGDLITYKPKNGVGHVVIYLGDGQTIESSGSKGVTIGSVDWDRVSAYKRVPGVG